MSLFDSDDPYSPPIRSMLSAILSRIAVAGALAGAVLVATDATAEPLQPAPEQPAIACGLSEATAQDIMAVLMNEVSQPPGAQVASFVRTYDALCRSARFGPCPHNRDEWEALHPTQ